MCVAVAKSSLTEHILIFCVAWKAWKEMLSKQFAFMKQLVENYLTLLLNAHRTHAEMKYETKTTYGAKTYEQYF